VGVWVQQLSVDSSDESVPISPQQPQQQQPPPPQQQGTVVLSPGVTTSPQQKQQISALCNALSLHTQSQYRTRHHPRSSGVIPLRVRRRLPWTCHRAGCHHSNLPKANVCSGCGQGKGKGKASPLLQPGSTVPPSLPPSSASE